MKIKISRSFQNNKEITKVFKMASILPKKIRQPLFYNDCFNPYSIVTKNNYIKRGYMIIDVDTYNSFLELAYFFMGKICRRETTDDAVIDTYNNELLHILQNGLSEKGGFYFRVDHCRKTAYSPRTNIDIKKIDIRKQLVYYLTEESKETAKFVTQTWKKIRKDNGIDEKIYLEETLYSSVGFNEICPYLPELLIEIFHPSIDTAINKFIVIIDLKDEIQYDSLAVVTDKCNHKFVEETIDYPKFLKDRARQYDHFFKRVNPTTSIRHSFCDKCIQTKFFPEQGIWYINKRQYINWTPQNHKRLPVEVKSRIKAFFILMAKFHSNLGTDVIFTIINFLSYILPPKYLTRPRMPR